MQHRTSSRRERAFDCASALSADESTNPGDSGELSPLDLPPRNAARNCEELERRVLELTRSEQLARDEARQHLEARQTRDRLLAMLSHELRMPLQPVLAAAAVLLRDPRMPSDLLDDLRIIQRNVQLEARLIDDLLDLTRITSGKLALERSRINLHAVIARAVAICQQDLAEKRLTLTTRLGAARSWVNADPGRLQQVLWNLLKNAVKFTPPDGQVTIETADGPGGRMIVRVIDNGAGISADALERIFEPFEQGGSQVTGQHGGLGLGLAISRMLIERHEGTISAASAGPGEGATFTITLATTDSPPPEAPVRGVYAEPPTHRMLRILLVEDDPSTALVMSKLLRSIGHTVHTAGDCATARAHAGKAIDLLLCDLGLPDGSGLTVLAPLKAAAPAPFSSIALTGYGSEDDVHNSRAAGFDAHLTKPITLEQLVGEINRLFP